MIYPERLNQDDIVGICAPASPIESKKFWKGVHFIEELGLKVKLSKNIYEVNGYLAGTDAQRLQDFHDLVEDTSVKAIIFARGGYGTARFVNALDFTSIKNNPKIIWGFSDITYLHWAIYAKTGLITFHGPMIMTAGREEFDSLSKESFKQLFTPEIRTYNELISSLKVLSPGEVEAPIIGGNLSLLVSTLGTPFEIDVVGKILVIEELNERIYKIDSMLNQLKLANKLKEVAGIVVGDFQNIICKKDGNRCSRKQTEEQLTKLFSHYFGNINGPVVSGFNIGHCFPHFAIPHGAMARLSSHTKTLTMEAGVK